MEKYRAGDLIWVRPGGFLFSLVRRWISSEYGHIGLVSGYCQDHVLIVEAGTNGVDINDLKWRVVKKENYTVYRINNLIDKQRDELVTVCLNKVGSPYDFSAWINFIIGSTVFGKDKEFICSELIYRALLNLGIVEKVYHPEKISPADLFKLLENKMTLVDEVKF